MNATLLAALLAPLLVHALATHGAWFAVIWLGLTSAQELVRRLYLGIGSDLGGVLTQGATVYLAALLAKGFAERSRFAGRVLPFALLAGGCAVVVALPAAALLVRAPLPHVVTAACAAFAFAFAYRSVSLRTGEDAKKALALTLLLPVLAAVAAVPGLVPTPS